MSICWWCYWGWPKPIRDIYDEAVQKLQDYVSPLHYGPAHIVWEDENWDSAQWCLDNFEHWKRTYNNGLFYDSELDVVHWSLTALLAVPDEFKHPPGGYDEDSDHPENFPPPPHWVMGQK